MYTLWQRLVARCVDSENTLGVAESLTGGLISAGVVEVAGASAFYRGSVTAYQIDIKQSLLGVDPVLLEEHGAVHPRVATQMALGVRRVLGASLGIASTGVAGPGSCGPHEAGTYYVAASTDGRSLVRAYRGAGTRPLIRAAAAEHAAALALELLNRPESRAPSYRWCGNKKTEAKV